MNQSEQIDQLAAALAAFQAEMPSVAKTHTARVPTKSGGEFTYSYADLADTVEAAAPKLAAHGLSVTQMPERAEGMDVLTTRVMHASGQWLEGTMRLFLAKEDPQAHGSAITYARRYGYCAALGIVADEDDDGAAATHAKPARPRKQTSAPAPAPATPNGSVPAGVAKQRLLKAFGGDVGAMNAAWGDRGSNPISETELAALEAGRPM